MTPFDRHHLKELLIDTWTVSPNTDEIEGYWYLRGWLSCACEIYHLPEREVLAQLDQFIYHLVNNDDGEDDEELVS